MQPVFDIPLHRRLGLADSELQRITADLEREPNGFELAVYSLLWSEHCGYKHSRLLLSRLPTTGRRVLQGPGENAGVIDAGDGLAVAFKVESHNHPSSVEPFQGAATGVGGILRDVVAMGARPLAVLDSLRFGLLGSERARSLFDGAVRGVGHYGNCVGVPNAGGEVMFEAGYENNCLVNAMCIGLASAADVHRARASGPGNVVVLYGARTGRDGIGGASVLASQDIDAGDETKRPSVQIGDPFTGKKLIECSLDLVARGLLISLQDLGAAGLASASAEMASKGGCGIELDLDQVALREEGMAAWEIMISESQERMAAVVAPNQLQQVLAACAEWELDAAVIGIVVDSDRLVCRFQGEVVGDMPVTSLVENCPRYPLFPQRPPRLAETPVDPQRYPPPPDLSVTLLALLAAPNIASKRWVYEQYDHIVGSSSVIRPGADAGLLRLTPSQRGVAVSLDGNGRRCLLEPRRGAAEAVIEAALNVACVGAEPAAVTNCLNFGNPERGETPYMLSEAVEGIAEACEALELAVVSGNVSLYNEHAAEPIPPTPIIGCVGVIDDVARAITPRPRLGDAVLLIDDAAEPAIDGSEYQRTIHGRVEGRIPAPGLASAGALCRFLVGAARGQMLSAAHDASDGGVGVALAELALLAGGIDVRVPDSAGRPDISLFGEGRRAVVATCAAADADTLRARAGALGLAASRIGSVTNTSRVVIRCAEDLIDVASATCRAAHADTLPIAMRAPSA